jgi:hypothetical protein
MKLTINKYVLIGFVALAILALSLLRPRREHLDLQTMLQNSDDPQVRFQQAQSKAGQINGRLSMMEYKIADSESKRNQSNEDANVALGSSSGKLS